MKKQITIIIIIIIVKLLFSCQQGLLDREPLDIISDGVVWDDPILVEAFIADIYKTLPYMHFGNSVNSNTTNAFNMPMLETLTDQAGGTRNNREPAIRKEGNTTQTGGLIDMWLYPQIRKMNEFYKNIENSSMDENKKNTFIGAIKFVEAFTYFEMAKRYGAVPIITKFQQLDDPDEELFPARTPETEVYTYAINVLDDILNNNLLNITEEKGYPTQGAVLALKSRIALYTASIARFGTVQLDGLLGVPKSEEDKFWQIAFDASNEVINSGNYSLYDEFSDDLHERFKNLLLDENSPERIFYKLYDGENIGHSYDASMAPIGFGPSFLNAGASPYLDFVESFEKMDGSSSIIPREWETNEVLVTLDELYGQYDPRMSASVLHEGSIFQGEELQFYNGLRLASGTIVSGRSGSDPVSGKPYRGKSRSGSSRLLYTGFSVRKYLDEELTDQQVGLSKTDKVIFRLAEMYLNRAEAAFYLDIGDKGLSDINAIRNRAGMPLRTSIGEDEIRYERMAELCFEDGARYWDLIRWRTALDAINKDFTAINLIRDAVTDKYLVQFITLTGDTAPEESAFRIQHYYKPITPGRIANNPNLGPENPNY